MQLGLQYARAMGIRVIAVDGGPEKEKLCKDLGAELYLDFKHVSYLDAEVRRITTWGGTCPSGMTGSDLTTVQRTE